MRRAAAADDDDNPRRRTTHVTAADTGRRPDGRALERARGLARLGARRCSRRSTPSATRRCRSRSAATGAGSSGPERARASCCGRAGRDAAGADPRRVAGRARATSTSCFPILHGPVRRGRHGAGAARARRTCRTSARACSPRRSAWTRTASRPCMRGDGIPVARNVTLRDGDPIENPFGYPCFVKPARLGSSVGISKAHDEEELRAAVELARRHDEKVLVEEFVSGTEVEVRRARQPRPDHVAPRRDRRRSRASGTTTRPSTTRAGWTCIVPPRDPRRAGRARAGAGASRAFVATECEGMARVGLLRPRRRRGARQRAEHDPRASRRRACTRSCSRPRASRTRSCSTG